jgi:hypothetical protein
VLQKSQAKPPGNSARGGFDLANTVYALDSTTIDLASTNETLT